MSLNEFFQFRRVRKRRPRFSPGGCVEPQEGNSIQLKRSLFSVLEAGKVFQRTGETVSQSVVGRTARLAANSGKPFEGLH